MDEMSSGDESYAETMPTDMLEDIRDKRQYYPSINSREARYKIHDHIKQRQKELKGALLSTRNMGKGSQYLLKAVVNDLLESLPFME